MQSLRLIAFVKGAEGRSGVHTSESNPDMALTFCRVYRSQGLPYLTA